MTLFAKKFGANDYDPPHEGWYDDWDSNAEAYAAWSIGWPVIWVAALIIICWKGILFFSQQLNKLKGESIPAPTEQK